MASAEDELREELQGSEPEETREPRHRRIVEPDAGGEPDDEKDMVGELFEDDDQLSAEEAAIHVDDETP